MCPFLEEPDPRCAAHLSLKRLDEALSLCADADNYQLCPIYRQKLRGETLHDRLAEQRLCPAG